ncbi:MAG: BlaI/MecI/CopY family transcriptional regulator [Balneolaceae bacterium]|nr:BlaI/MecI/CopY family transcriptional regulator [Balneolaceae bacterium]
MSLSKAEEELMQHLWNLETAFLNDLLRRYPEPKPASSTVATLLKRMIDKGFVEYNQRGRSREYYPLVSKSDYFSGRFKSLINRFFDSSTAQFASFFASEGNLSSAELEELKQIIEQEIEKKKQ